ALRPGVRSERLAHRPRRGARRRAWVSGHFEDRFNRVHNRGAERTVAALMSGWQFSSIDDYLGPGATRFFGSGYRRVRYGWHDLEAGGPTRGTIPPEAGGEYP